MNTRIYLAKHVPDPARREPRNIGVVLVSGTERALRFLGEDASGKIEGRSVRFSVGARAEVYREWVRHWRRAILDEGADPASLHRSDRDTFFIEPAGEVWLDHEEQPTKLALAEYFARLVQPEDEHETELKVAVERLLDASAMTKRKDFERDVEVPTTSRGPKEVREVFRFEYGRQNGRMIVGHRVPLEIDAFVHDAVYRYERIAETVGRVTFVQGLQDSIAKPAVKNLQAWSRIVDVADPSATEDILDAFEISG